jgi:hypothetical protein
VTKDDTSIRLKQMAVLNSEHGNPYYVQNSFQSEDIVCTGFRLLACNECPGAPLRPSARHVICPDAWNHVECSRSLNMNIE